MKWPPHRFRFVRLLPLLALVVGCGKDKGPTTSATDTGVQAVGALAGHRVSASADLTGDGVPDVVISAPGANGDGSVLIFDATQTGTQDPSAATATIAAEEAHEIGDGLMACGDLDGDGNRDLAIGMPNGNSNRGGVWLLSGPLSGDLTPDAGVLVRGNDPDADAGFTVDCRGDFDNDGRADVLFSAPLADGFGIAERVGQVFFHHSIDGGTDAVASFSSTFGGSQMGYHRSLVLDEDLDGDGLDDAVMGAHGSARLYVLLAPFAGTYDANYSGQTLHGRDDLDSTGFAIATGDLDGDGYADVATGAPRHEAQLGAVGIVSGPFDGITSGNVADLGRWIDGQDPKEFAGHAIDIADDLNGDGMGDLIIGAPGSTTSGASAGVVYIVHGPAPAGNVTSADHVLLGTQAGAQLGYSVAAVPDATGDGLDEVLVGAPTRSDGDRTSVGAAFLFHSPLSDRVEDGAATTTYLF